MTDIDGNDGNTIRTKDGTRIFYLDWGPKDAQPIVFHHGWPLSADDWDNQMLFFLSQGLSRDRARPPRSRTLDARPTTATTWTLMPPTSPSSSRARSQERDPCRPLDRRRRSCALRRPARHRARCQSRADRRGAAGDGEVGVEPGRPPDRSLRRLPRGACRQPRATLSRCSDAARSTASTDPARRSREGMIRNWWRQGMMGSVKARLRLHQGLLGDRLHRRPEVHRCARSRDARRRRPDRAVSPIRRR